MEYWSINDENKKRFNKEHVNTTIIAVWFKLRAGTYDFRDSSTHIVIREFRFGTLDSERQAYWDTELTQIYIVCPLDSYKPELTPWLMETQVFPDDFFITLAADELIYYKYKTSTSIGCGHYCRGCLVYCTECLRFYGCRMCHDEAEEHKIVPSAISTVKCRNCGTVQPFAQDCINCGLRFGWYCCTICKLICDLGPDIKPIFHSAEQQECVLGIQEYMKYCPNCKWSYLRVFFDEHKCKQIVGYCCCCFEDFGNDTKPRMVLDCGHLIHAHCLNQMVLVGYIACPLCRKTMLDKVYRIYYRAFYEYQARRYFCVMLLSEYLCYDCGCHFEHFVNHYAVLCSQCGMFNTVSVNDVSFDYYALQQWLNGYAVGLNAHLAQLQFKSQMTLVDFKDRVKLTDAEAYLLEEILAANTFTVNNYVIMDVNHMMQQANERDADFTYLLQSYFLTNK